MTILGSCPDSKTGPANVCFREAFRGLEMTDTGANCTFDQQAASSPYGAW